MKKIEMNIPSLPYAVEEALNQLRVNIKFCGKNTKKILITSSVPDEGKSMISVYLWKMLAEAGFPTVLVDLDLRKSMAKNRWNMQGTDGMTGIDYYLSGLAEYEDVLYCTNIENGYVVPVSNLLENPSPLLEDPRLEECLDRLAKEYRYVIIDSPPLAAVSDGVQIAYLSDGAILVVRSGETSKKLVRESMQQLKRANCRFLGFVLNRVNIESHSYARHYYAKYGYGEYYGKNMDDSGKDSGDHEKYAENYGENSGIFESDSDGYGENSSDSGKGLNSHGKNLGKHEGNPDGKTRKWRFKNR